MTEEHKSIIIEALRDYANWFTDQGGNEDEILADKAKLKLIDDAYKYINNLEI